MHIPSDTAIKMHIGDEKIPAMIISCEEFNILLQTKADIGEKVENIEFSMDPTFLLDKLIERIENIDIKDYELAYQISCLGRTKITPNKGIRTGQRNAISRANTEPITFIWGPPGTGKTETLADIVIEHVCAGHRVAMLSYSNVSVDGAILRVANKIDFEPGAILRYGFPVKKEVKDSDTLSSHNYVVKLFPKLKEEMDELRTQRRKLAKNDPNRTRIEQRINEIHDQLSDKEKELVQNAVFVATTLSKAVVDKTIYAQRFDVVIVDEASMAFVPHIVVAASLAKSFFVCLGDFKQLPAIVQNSDNVWLKNDIFDHTGITGAVEEGFGHEWLVMLNEQYRMHPDVSRFLSKEMYSSILQTATSSVDEKRDRAAHAPLPDEAAVLSDISGSYSVCLRTMDGSRVNILSALMCIRYAETFANEYPVGIITPYSAQSRFIMSIIRDLQDKDPEKYRRITCSTVHQFQGSEQTIIIFDAVDCFREPYPGVLLTSQKNNMADRLFNVALSRSAGKVIMIGNIEYFKRKKLSKDLLLYKFINEMEKQKTSIDVNQALDYFSIPGDYLVYAEDAEYSWESFTKDLLEAKKKIQIEIPGIIDDDEDKIEQLCNILEENLEKDIDIKLNIQSGLTLPRSLMTFATTSGYVTNPITIIDDRILWFGQPLCAADFISEGEYWETEYFPCFRVESKRGVNSVKALLGL